MKWLLLVLAPLICSAADTSRVSACFQVNALVRADEDHYWADWKNSCPFTIDRVYVMVEFFQQGRKIGQGVWPSYFVTSGQARVVRFSSPIHLPSNSSITVFRITTDSSVALYY